MTDQNECKDCSCAIEEMLGIGKSTYFVERSSGIIHSIEQCLRNQLGQCWNRANSEQQSKYDALKELAQEREAHARTKAERKHWKANHDEAVKRVAAYRDRPDLPPERVKAIDAFIQRAENAELTALREIRKAAFVRLEEILPRCSWNWGIQWENGPQQYRCWIEWVTPDEKEDDRKAEAMGRTPTEAVEALRAALAEAGEIT